MNGYVFSVSLAVVVCCFIMLMIYFYPLDVEWNMRMGFGLGVPASLLLVWSCFMRSPGSAMAHSAGWRSY